MVTKSRQWIPLVAVLAVSAALIGTIAVSTAGLSPTRYQGLLWNNYGMTPDLARLSDPRTAADEPPAFLVRDWKPGERFSMVPDSFRLLGEHGGVNYWAARDGNGNVCLALSGPDGGAAAGCNSIRMFNQTGSGMGYSGVPDRVILIAYLVPDRALPAEAVGLETPVPGIVTVPAGTKKGTEFEVPVSRGTPIPVNVFR